MIDRFLAGFTALHEDRKDQADLELAPIIPELAERDSTIGFVAHPLTIERRFGSDENEPE
ncbi:hypothetical protein [Sphingomonas sp.]|jgi:hypothetical protein|uniref:hypothetical protein n=1 Tax=Sphingomonas sp. TaxID=28214 RepID=UPI002E37D3C7|nr:hypothetical protein [Sphingomonas sp.]HEX4695088.1 hypothetical protein [Sphingomonas sp.]